MQPEFHGESKALRCWIY